MSKIQEAINNIVEGNLDAMRTNFTDALNERASEALDAKKIDVAQNYFGSVNEVSKEKVGKYIKANAMRSNDDHYWQGKDDRDAERDNKKSGPVYNTPEGAKKREKGLSTAIKKLTGTAKVPAKE